jgi:hypothetical protein
MYLGTDPRCSPGQKWARTTWTPSSAVWASGHLSVMDLMLTATWKDCGPLVKPNFTFARGESQQ